MEQDIKNPKEIKEEIISCLKNKDPFSVARFGDWEMQFMNSYLNLKNKKLLPKEFGFGGFPKNKAIAQGVRNNYVNVVANIFKDCGNQANYISDFSVWTDGNWVSDKGNIPYLKYCRKIYNLFGIRNLNYCSPDIGMSLFIEGEDFVSELKKFRICIISGRAKEASETFTRNSFSVFPINIIGAANGGLGKGRTISLAKRYNTISVCHSDEYENNVKQIENLIGKADIFLVGAGFLSKGYSNVIKKLGKVAIDVGKMVDYWVDKSIPYRVQGLLTSSTDITIKYTDKGRRFSYFL